MIADAADHQLRNRIEGELRRLAAEHIGDAREDVRRRNRREVVLESEERHGRLGREALTKPIGEGIDAVHRVDGIVRRVCAQRLDERGAHVLVITGVQHELDLARLDQRL